MGFVEVAFGDPRKKMSVSEDREQIYIVMFWRAIHVDLDNMHLQGWGH